MEFIRGIATQISFQLGVLSSVSRTEPGLRSNNGGLYKRLNCFLKSIVCWPRTKEGVSYNAKLIFQSEIQMFGNRVNISTRERSSLKNSVNMRRRGNVAEVSETALSPFSLVSGKIGSVLTRWDNPSGSGLVLLSSHTHSWNSVTFKRGDNEEK